MSGAQRKSGRGATRTCSFGSRMMSPGTPATRRPSVVIRRNGMRELRGPRGAGLRRGSTGRALDERLEQPERLRSDELADGAQLVEGALAGHADLAPGGGVHPALVGGGTEA